MIIDEQDNSIVNNFNSDDEVQIDLEGQDINNNIVNIIDHTYNHNIYNFNYVYMYFTNNGKLKIHINIIKVIYIMKQ